MKTLRETFVEARAGRYAIGHFNVSDSNQLKALALAVKETGLPVVVGLSEGERDFFPMKHARAIVDGYRAEGLPMFLNADHTYSLGKAKAAIDAGVDSIVVDGAALPLADNIALVQSVVAYARACGRDVLVEGELGYIGKSSEITDTLPEGASVTEEMMTKPEELAAFVAATGVDAMAPAVGNVHGMVTSGNPKLSMERIAALVAASTVPLVLHGGSGSSDEEFAAAARAGISMVHINTEFRLTYRTGIEHGLQSHPHEVAPYKFLTPAVENMTRYIAQKIRLFGGVVA